MKYLNLFFCTFLFMCIFSSCNDEDIIQKENTEINHEKQSDIAIFGSQTDFDNYIENYHDNKTLPLQLQNITSLANNYQLKSAESDEEIETEDSLIISDVLKNFVNTNHEIIIEGVYFKITKTGTYFTIEENMDLLKTLLPNETLHLDAEHVTEALGYFYEKHMYKLNTEYDMYFFDTYRIKDPITYETPTTATTLKSSSSNTNYVPWNISWKETNDGRTLVGKTWDKIWGFSKSVRNNFDSKHRVDVKFYAQRFPFYSEMGIKTKTQKKGWTGVWRKQTVPNIVNGWEYLHIKEKWNENFFHPNFDPWSQSLQPIRFKNQFGVDLGYGTIKFLNQTFVSWNIMGFDIELKYKDAAKEVWNLGKDNNKVIGNWLNGGMTEQNMNKESIRVIERNKTIRSTENIFGPYFRKRTRTDKSTLIMFKSSGGTLGYDLLKGGVAYKNLSAKYEFLSGTVLYGAAEKNDKWCGVKLTFR